jgi:DNA-binding NtrC family response regulator
MEKILIADDDRNIQFAFKRLFEEKSYSVVTADNGLEVLKVINQETPDLIFMDISMPKRSGLEILELLNEKGIEIPVIIITGFGTMNTAIKAIQLGAYDYLSKPLDIDKVLIVAKRALEMVALRTKLEKLNLGFSDRSYKGEIIGNHPKMQDVYKVIGSISKTPNSTNILINGESGTGKELVAQAIHTNSGKPDRPFIALNCSVLPENLLETELFGYEKGAFTDATQRNPGKFEAAEEGTIFLDEIGDMPLNLQKKLLRVLQEREFYRVGGNNLNPVRARFIAATNKTLDQEVELGNFRQDLFYRLNVISIDLPPLRERGDDISFLLNHFIGKYSSILGKNISSVMPDVVEYLTNYQFPGNVRELENFVERAITVTTSTVLRLADFPDQINSSHYNIGITSLVLEEARVINNNMFERNYLFELMKASKGKINTAAELAMVDRRTISRLLQKHKVSPKDFK